MHPNEEGSGAESPGLGIEALRVERRPETASARILFVVCGILGVPAMLAAFFSILILDAPWASKGKGALLAWVFIADCWAIPICLYAVVHAMRYWKWSALGASVFFYPAAVALVIALLIGSK
jgi:hypothetical protein